jgi:predicted amidohydrolase
VKVLVLQRSCVSPPELDGILAEETLRTGRAVDFVVLPEGAHRESGLPSLAENTSLRDLAAVVRKHECYACLGTMSEHGGGGGDGGGGYGGGGGAAADGGGRRHHCTALVVGPDGALVATYRKRAVLGLRQAPGAGPCTFRTKFGNVGVLICYDAENPEFVAEALAEDDPVLMLNPVHIAAEAIAGGGGCTGASQGRGGWP